MQLTIPADRKPAQQLKRDTRFQVSTAIGASWSATTSPPRLQAANKRRPWHWRRAPEGVGAWSHHRAAQPIHQRVWHAPRHDRWQKDDLPRQRTWQAGDVTRRASARWRWAAFASRRTRQRWIRSRRRGPSRPGASRWIGAGQGPVQPSRNHAPGRQRRPLHRGRRNVALGASQTDVVVRDATAESCRFHCTALRPQPCCVLDSRLEIAAGQVREDEKPLRHGRRQRRGPRASATAGPSEPVVRWTRTARATSPWVPPGPRAPGALDGGGALKRRRDALGCCLRLPRPTLACGWNTKKTTVSGDCRARRRCPSLRAPKPAFPTARIAASLCVASTAPSTRALQPGLRFLGREREPGHCRPSVRQRARDLQGDDLQVSASYTYRFGSKASVGVRARQAPGQDALTTRATYRTEGAFAWRQSTPRAIRAAPGPRRMP